MQVAVLGSVSAWLGDGRVGLGGPKDRAVLAMLALACPRAVSESDLLDGLWGEDPPTSGTRAVRNQVFRLRRALREAGVDDDLIATEAGGYRLSLDPSAVDAHRADQLAGEARRACEAGDLRSARLALEEALGLWRGSALADVTDLPFARAEVVRLEELRLALLEERFDLQLALGEHHELVADLHAAVQASPLRERLWCQLMLALHRAGRQVEALRAFQELRTYLDEELGLAPGPDAVALERRIAVGDPALDPPRPATPGGDVGARTRLPQPRTRFVGRDEDRAEVPRLFDVSPCVTLVGPGGVGKTRLALEVASEIASGRRDGATLVDLGALDETGLVVHALARAIEVEDRAGHDLLERVLGRLAPSDALLLLDNCEHVIDEVAAVAETVLQRCPEVVVLATSRESLRIDGELVWRLAPLSLPDLDAVTDLDAVNRSEAVQLIADRAALVRRGFAVDATNAEAVARIATQLDGIPLGLELAAAALEDLEPADLADRLTERFTALPPGRRTAPDRQRTLWATIEWSYERLPAALQALLARLALFTADFSTIDATEVCGEDLGAVEDGLAQLVQRSLLQPVAEATADEPGRFRLLDTVREFGRLALEGSADRVETVQRLLRWAAARRASAGGWAIDFGDDREAARTFDVDYANLRGALRIALDDGDPDVALELIGGLGAYWHLRALDGEGRGWVEEALAMDGAAEASARHPHALLCAEAVGSPVDFGARARFAEAARAAAQSIGAPAVEAISLAVLGLSTSERGEPAAGRACFEEAHELARTAGDEGVLACVLERLAEAQARDGDDELADATLAEASALYRELGNRRGELWCLATVGHRAMFRDDPSDARGAYERGLELATELGYRRGEGWMRTALGQAHLLTGDPTAAVAEFARASSLQRRIGDDLNLGWSMRGQVRARLALGDAAGAIEVLEELVQVLRRPHRVPADVGGLVRTTALVAAALGEWSIATELHQRWSALPDRGHLGPVEDADLAWLLARIDVPDGAPEPGDAVERTAQLLAALAKVAATEPPLDVPLLPGRVAEPSPSVNNVTGTGGPSVP